MAKISPVIIFSILIVTIFFFALGLIYILIRCLMKTSSFPSHSQGSFNYSQAFQTQLQHLFRLQDLGLDRALIDALPVFHYKDIIGSKDTFDCAICLCEFTGSDELKCLPDCSHAFHIHCIETWLMSNSKCPLCRSPIGNPLYSFDDSMRLSNGSFSRESGMSIRLGTFKNLNDSVGSSGSSVGPRRCYSLGAFQYVVGDEDLQVSLSSGARRRSVSLCNNHRSKSYIHSVSKIWLWSKMIKFSGNSEDKVAVLPIHDRSDSV